jgi:methylase of polypeptide subunit release factors
MLRLVAINRISMIASRLGRDRWRQMMSARLCPRSRPTRRLDRAGTDGTMHLVRDPSVRPRRHPGLDERSPTNASLAVAGKTAFDGEQTAALVELGHALRNAGYQFVAPTPNTHRQIRSRARTEARTVRDVFGWNCPFPQDLLPPDLFSLCDRSGVLQLAAEDDSLLISRVRFSTVDLPPERFIFVHSAFPTNQADAVFFGPDSYRFAALLRRTVKRARRVVDVGCGTGVGGLVLASRVDEVVLTDVNPRALEFAAVNAQLANCKAESVSFRYSDVLAGVDPPFDVVVSNPPYLVGPEQAENGRLYRDGGGPQGIDLSMRIVIESLARLRSSAGGQLVLYTGVPIVDGTNILQDRLDPVLRSAATRFDWEELDPDVFGEELARRAYERAERIAVVALNAFVEV